MASWTEQVKEILIQNGCAFYRQGKGDHEIWTSPHNDGRKFPVDAKIKSRHTANEIMKQAGLSHRFR
jgi:predicted RNA binding protein YcfA (HicA-like mRNA interferase family)